MDYADLAAAGSADAFCQPDQNALGASQVAEAIHVFVLDYFVDELRAVLAEPDERVVEVVHVATAGPARAPPKPVGRGWA